MEGVESRSESVSSRGSSSGRGRPRGKRNKAPLRDVSRCKIAALDAAQAEPGLLAKIAGADATTTAPAAAPVAKKKAISPAVAQASSAGMKQPQLRLHVVARKGLSVVHLFGTY